MVFWCVGKWFNWVLFFGLFDFCDGFEGLVG